MKLRNTFQSVSPSTTLIMILITILGSITTFWAWRSSQSSAAQTLNDSTVQRITTLEKSLDERLVSYESVLEGGAGLYTAKEGQITKQQWDKYANAHRINEQFPGVDALGYVENFPASQLEEHTAKIRSQGIPDYTVESEVPTDNYSVVVYLSPQTPTSPIGYNMLSDPLRAQTLNQAKETGSAVMSPALALKGRSNLGFVMVYPIYKDPSLTLPVVKGSPDGYVYVAVNVDQLLEVVQRQAAIENFQFAVSEGKAEADQKYIYSTPGFNSAGQGTVSQAVSVHTRGWIIHANIDTSSELYKSATAKPLIVVIIGMLATAILTVTIGQILSSRYKHIDKAKENELQRSRDELLSLASHQLRTPATAVKHYVGMLLQGYGGKIDKKQREFLNRAYAANERQLEIVNQILHISRIESGMLELTNKPVDIGKITQKIIRGQKKTLNDKNQNIKTSIQRGLPKVIGDESYLEIVMENLLTNASKYTPAKGNISVTIIADDPGVVIEVSDTGVGIDKKDMSQLFKKFSRIHNELSISSGGSGIGLYLSKLIIELHGGEIETISRIGVGTTFRVKLPIMSEEL